MKTRVRLLTCLGALGLFLVLFPGCYTQLETSKGEDERGEGREYQSQGQGQYQDSSYADQGDHREYQDSYEYDNGWQPRSSIGFSYYYPSHYWPSYAFNSAYYDPWSFNFGFNYGYSGFYTPYPYSYAGYYSPYYPYGYYPSYYPYAYSKNGYTVNPLRHGSRSFGDTRGVSGGGRGATINTQNNVPPPVVNTDRGGYNLPTGARVSPNPTGGAVHNPAPATVSPRSAAPQRSATVRGGTGTSNGKPGHAVRGWGGGRGAARSGGNGSGTGNTQAKPGGRDTQATPAAPPAKTNGGSRESGAQRGSPPAPRPQAPAPSSGGRGGNGNRGSGGGGGRR